MLAIHAAVRRDALIAPTITARLLAAFAGRGAAPPPGPRYAPGLITITKTAASTSRPVSAPMLPSRCASF